MGEAKFAHIRSEKEGCEKKNADLLGPCNMMGLQYSFAHKFYSWRSDAGSIRSRFPKYYQETLVLLARLDTIHRVLI